MCQISVVIPTRDGAGPLKACLAALARSFPPNAETVVVWDGGAIDLEPRLEVFAEPLRLRCIRTRHAGPAVARNRGLAVARGEIVAFTDDDCRPHAGWLTALASGVSVSPPRAAGGTTLNGLESSPYADAAQVILDLVAQHDQAAFGGERFFPSNNCAFPAAALRHVGGFDESFRTAEDRELCRRWRRAGFALDRVPEAVVDHDARADLPGFLRKFFAYGRGAARFHSTGDRHSLRESAAFHVRLPALVGPEVIRRGPRRGASLVTLLALWEVANLAGFLVETASRASSETTAARASSLSGLP
jgi:GT2 family glycosyltransferase